MLFGGSRVIRCVFFLSALGLVAIGLVACGKKDGSELTSAEAQKIAAWPEASPRVTWNGSLALVEWDASPDVAGVITGYAIWRGPVPASVGAPLAEQPGWELLAVVPATTAVAYSYSDLSGTPGSHYQLRVVLTR